MNVSIRRNLAASYAARGYNIVVGIAMAPIYLSYMGIEAYGLIGLFTMMMGWFQLLDMGLTPTLIRESARFRGGVVGIDSLRSLVRALEIVFGGVAAVASVMMAIFARQIAARWLNVHTLSVDTVSHAVLLMGLGVPLRWMSGLYRGVVSGFERQVFLGVYTIAVTTVRYVGVLGVFLFVGVSPVYFFAFQLVVAAAELVGLALATHLLVQRGPGPRSSFSWRPLRETFGFSLTIAFSAAVFVAVSQTDKLLLSRILPLSAYGAFSIAVVAAGAILSVSTPFEQVLLPRLAKLVAEGDEAGTLGLYFRATQAVCVLVCPAVTVIVLFAGTILRVWTGKPDLDHDAAEILRLYSVGNGFLAIGTFAYYIQYAKGDLTLHFAGQTLMLLLLVPLFAVAAGRFGGVGTGAVWASVNGLYAIAWVPIVHARVLRRVHRKWLGENVLPIVLANAAAGGAIDLLLSPPESRWKAAAFIMLAGVVLLAASVAASSAARHWVMGLLWPAAAGHPKGGI